MTSSSITPDSDNLKRCRTCGEWKPDEAFSRRQSSPNGLSTQCRACHNEAARRYYANNPEAGREASRRFRLKYPDRVRETNRRCDEKNPEAKRARRRRHYEENADFARDYSRRYRAANHDEVLEYLRRYRDSNRDSLRDYDRRYREAHIDYHREKARKWANLNPEKRRVIKNRRSARQRNLPSELTNSEWQFALDHFSGCCAVCGRQPGLWHGLAADHWIPISSPECPGTVAWNIVPLCHGVGGCNNSKANKSASEWLIEKFGKRKGNAIQRRIEAFLESRKTVLAESE